MSWRLRAYCCSLLRKKQDEAIKLETSNRILKKKIKVIESQMKQLLLRSKISEEERQ